MGEFLSTPIKDKISEDNDNSLVLFNLTIVKIRRLWNAGMEEENGGLPHKRLKHG